MNFVHLHISIVHLHSQFHIYLIKSQKLILISYNIFIFKVVGSLINEFIYFQKHFSFQFISISNFLRDLWVNFPYF